MQGINAEIQAEEEAQCLRQGIVQEEATKEDKSHNLSVRLYNFNT